MAETDVDGAQWDALGTAVGRAASHPVAVTGSGDAQWDALGTAVGRTAGHPCSSEAAGARRHHVLGTAVYCAASRAVGLGRRAKRSQVRLERTEAGSLDSFGKTRFSLVELRVHRHGSHVSPLHSIICVLITVFLSLHTIHTRACLMHDVWRIRWETQKMGDVFLVYKGEQSPLVRVLGPGSGVLLCMGPLIHSRHL